MNIGQLAYFRQVARLRSITQTANELGMTQPALSRAIGRLEHELGVPLFNRESRPLTLTRYGKIFYRRIAGALDEIEAGRRELADQHAQGEALVSFGFLHSLGASVVPMLVREFLRQHSHVRFTFVQKHSTALEAGLISGDLSLCLTASRSSHPKAAWSQVGIQRMCLIVPEDHRYAGRKTVRMRDLEDETFLSFERGHAIREFTDGLCTSAGFEPRIGFEAQDTTTIRGFVKAGFGIGLVPLLSVANDSPFILIEDRDTSRPIGLSWLSVRYFSKAERAFRAFVRTNAQRVFADPPLTR